MTDRASVAAAGRTATPTVNLTDFTAASYAQVQAELTPRYLQQVTAVDGWKNPYDFYLDIAEPQGLQVMAIRSGGKDGAFDADTYTPGACQPMSNCPPGRTCV